MPRLARTRSASGTADSEGPGRPWRPISACTAALPAPASHDARRPARTTFGRMAPRTGAEQGAWLARTPEEPLAPARPIVDPHHHLWDHVQPPYLLDDLLADTGSGPHVTDTVYMECGWGWDRAAADP